MNEIFEYTQQEIDKVNKLILDSLSNRNKHIQDIGQYLISAGGKRLRPIFTILSAKLFNYAGDKHIYVATSVELIHTATLLHDDVVDQSTVRRGKQTVNYTWSNKYAVLVGDFLFSQAFKMMVATDSIEVLNILSNASSIISEGEVKQVSNIGKINITKAEYYEVIRGKTAELFAAACETGAVISGQPMEICKKLYSIGLNSGIAFQIIDDLLDYIANEKVLGKKLGDDFFEKKITLPIIILSQKASEIDKKQLRIFFEQSTQQNFELLLKLVEKYDVINLVKEEAKYYIDTAINTLQTLESTNEAQQKFIKLLKQQIERIY
jgi:octaprenyl-diphosphate synthase